MLKTVYIETSNHFGNLLTTLFSVLFEGKCFQFFYEFFYNKRHESTREQHASAVKVRVFLSMLDCEKMHGKYSSWDASQAGSLKRIFKNS